TLPRTGLERSRTLASTEIVLGQPCKLRSHASKICVLLDITMFGLLHVFVPTLCRDCATSFSFSAASFSFQPKTNDVVRTENPIPVFRIGRKGSFVRCQP